MAVVLDEVVVAEEDEVIHVEAVEVDSVEGNTSFYS